MAKKKDKKVPPQKRKPLNENSNELAALLQQAKAANPIPVPVRQQQPQKKVVKGKTDFLGSNNATNKLVKPMAQEEITATLQKIENGTKFRVQYKKDCAGDTIYLASMVRNSVLASIDDNEVIIHSVAISHDWGETQLNRIFTLKAINWSKGWIGRFERAIESIEIIS